MNSISGYHLFMLFLKRNNVLEKFIYNFKKEEHENLYKYLKDLSPCDYLSSSFFWSNTREEVVFLGEYKQQMV